MKRKLNPFWWFLIALGLANFLLGLKLNYPPYESELNTLFKARLSQPGTGLEKQEQEVILNNLLSPEKHELEKLFPLRSKLQIFFGTKSIWNLRGVNFLLLTGGMVVFFLVLEAIGWERKTLFLALVLLAVSPLLFSTWLFRPKVCLTLFLLFSWAWFWVKERFFPWLVFWFFLFYSSFQGFLLALVILTPLVLIRLWQKKKYFFLGWVVFLVLIAVLPKTKGPVFNQTLKQNFPLRALNFSQAATEVSERFREEDSLKERILFPLWLRRMGYNKLFFTYRNLIREALAFFDLETLFFQEVHPLHQKSEVIFYWPLIFFFIWGGVWLVRSRFGKKQRTLSGLILLSWVWFLVTNDSPSGRHLLTLFILSLVVSQGLRRAPKKALGLGMIFLIWSVWINAFDILKRPLFWYDNRAFVYEQGMKTIQKRISDYSELRNIFLTSLVGNPKLYYFYYEAPPAAVFLEDSEVIKRGELTIHFRSFNLKDESLTDDSFYFGFLGEFVGSKFANDFSKGDLDLIEERGLKTEKVWKLDNTIAFRYSDWFVLASNGGIKK